MKNIFYILFLLPNLFLSQSIKWNWIGRIRFVVNCNGKSDRFRILTVNYDYEPIEFDKNITSQLLNITKSLICWIPKSVNGKKVDYYQYLIFKIKDGKIDEILP